jgi:hypothetical protein
MKRMSILLGWCFAVTAIMISPARVFGRAAPPSPYSRMAEPEFDKSSKDFSGRGSPCLDRQQDLNSPIYCDERRCDELRYE